MKIKGQSVCLKPTIVVIPMQGVDFVFKFSPVRDSGIEHLLPRPTPPQVIRPGQGVTTDPLDPDYLAAMARWRSQKNAYDFIISILATDGLELETVSLDKPETWTNIDSELEASLGPGQLAKLYDAYFEANGLDSEKIDEATKSFLLGQAKLAEA